MSSTLGGSAVVLPAAHQTEHDGNNNNNLSFPRQVTINCNNHPERRN